MFDGCPPIDVTAANGFEAQRLDSVEKLLPRLKLIDIWRRRPAHSFVDVTRIVQRAQQTYLNLLIGAEADRRMATMELFTTAVEYKQQWGPVLAERARSGASGPEPVPHPDDVIIDPVTGQLRIDGPVLEVEKAAQEWLRANSMEFLGSLVQVNEKLESDPNNSKPRKEQRELAKIIDWLRDDNLKRTMRDALRRPPGKSRKD